MLIYLSSSHCSLNVPDCHWCRAGEGGRAGGHGGAEWLRWRGGPGAAEVQWWESYFYHQALIAALLISYMCPF